ncbi:MAG TPA: nuclear transport factor 2 family protein [Candidatus Acidoferrales bacterium]|nr:nuclear transport factor 2 family protein [Candidatus Acidoferrales bacterium]
MRKATIILLSGIAVLLVASAVSSRSTQSSYAEDRAQIEDLQARYMFALDFHDADTYASTFTEDGVLDYGPVVKGRDAIRKLIAGMAKNAADQAAKDTSGLRPAVGRHNISNIAIKIDGNKAVGRAYWFHYGNNNPKRTASLDSFGDYEDEMVKVDGKWLFSKRKIYNEQVDKWAYHGGNPAW